MRNPCIYVNHLLDSGVESGEASTSVSITWQRKTKEEKDAYKAQNQATGDPEPRSEEPLESSHLESITLSNDPVGPNTRTKNLPLASARTAVNNFMIRWQAEVRMLYLFFPRRVIYNDFLNAFRPGIWLQHTRGTLSS